MSTTQNCPTCDRNARKVKRITLESLLVPERRADLDPSQYFVCATPDCDTVYFTPESGRTFSKPDLTVRFGLKETDAPHHVCYCFDHTTEEIEDEIRRTGRSTVLESIKADMSGPGCRCEVTNPLGACCLNTVQAAVTDAFRSITIDESAVRAGSDQRDHCCETQNEIGGRIATAKTNRGRMPNPALPPDARPDRTGTLAAGGSVVAAILSSACCWLPLLLIVFGASAAGVAGFFEAYRPYLMTAAVVLLGFGFYTVYFQKQQCAPGSACATPSRKLGIFNQTMLWTATMLVAAFVFFPNYVGYAIGAPMASHADVAHLPFDEYHIEGMTCEGCANTLNNELIKLSNVAAVEVDYTKKSAIVRYQPNRPIPADRVIETVKAAGYNATVATAGSPPS